MSTETRPLAEIRQHLSRYVDDAVRTHARFDITRNGTRAAVLMSADDYDALLETLDILSDPDLVRDIAQGEHDLAEGRLHTLDDVTAELVAAAKIPPR